MKTRRILSFTLALTMLLSLFSGMSFANAAAPRMVPVGEELAYDPLAETASIAYEQHEDGYAVTLDRAADSVTMHLTAVPDSGRKAEGARLYIRTGTELKAGTAYRVSFALWSEKKLTEYTACFDGADTASAYGKLEKRSIEAGGTDRVEYLVTPTAESGELVLRLLLGNAEVGALRLSGLAVEESSAEAAGNNVMLVDKLDYNAPGSVTIWTNDDYSATLTTRGESATMTMTEVPKTGKEVWKAKLLVATGLHLEAGKTYRVRADLQSSGGQKYELCFNSGDTEKGYDVLYNQNLGSEVEHLIYVPTYKTDLGELIIQFSLGNLSKGAVTTLRDVRVDEVKAVYKNMLDGDFSFEGSRVKKTYDDLMIHTDNGTEVAKVKWDDGTVVTKSGDRAGQMDVDADQGSATLEVKAGSTNHPWDARLNVDVAGSFENDAIYRVSFNLHSLLAFNCELQIGKTFAADGIGCDPYDISFHWINPGDNEVMYLFSAKASERHLFQLLVGETHGAANTVTLSNLKVERMDGGTVSTTELASVTYPESGNNAIEMAGNPWGNRAMYTVTSDHKIVLKVLETPGDGVWKSKIIIDTGVANAEGKTVQFDIKALEKNEANWEVLIGSGAHSENMRKVVGDKEITSTGIKNGNETSPFSTTTNNNTAGTVFITLQLGISQNTYEISNIKVGETDVIPKSLGSFSYYAEKEYAGNIVGDGNSAVVDCWHNKDDSDNETADPDGWKRRVYVDTNCNIQSGKAYQVVYTMSATNADKEYEVDYNRDNVQKGYGAKYGLKTKTSVDTVSYTAFANADGRLNLEFQLGKADHTDITIKDISVKEITTPAQTVTNGKFVSVLAEVNQDGGDYTLESLSRNADNAVLNITKAPASGTEGYMAKLLIRTGVTPQRGKEYTVSFDIKATKAQAKFHALYNGVADKSYGGEYEIPLAAETTRIISHNIEWYQCNGKGELVIQLELGLIDQTGGNEFTVSNVSITEYSVESSREEVNRETINAADYDVQSGYSVDLTRTENSATLNILKTPGGKLEAWKNKLFIDTGVHAFEGNSYRVTMDVTAEKDMDFEVYYNRDDEEKGYDAVFDLHATGGKRMTLEKVFTAERNGDLKIQLSLGKVPAENAVTVSNVRIERAEYTYSDVSALPAPLIYRTPGAVSYWAHNDYTVAVTGTDSASTVNIVKLFVRTGAMLQAGKSYQVRANLLAARAQDFEVCYNNEETEKGFDALYGQKLAAGVKTTVDKKITVPASMTDAGELVIQFSVGGAVANDITVSDVSVQEVRYGSSVGAAPDTVIGLRQSAQAAGTLDVSREKLSYHMTKIAADSSAITMAGANLREGDRYTVAFTAKADKALNGTLTLAQAGGKSTAISQQFALTTEPQQYSFTTAGGLSEGGFYDIFWQFGSAEKTPVDVEISDITVFAPSERLEIMPSGQRVTVNGVEVKPDAYNINGSNYFKLRDLAMLLNGTDGQFVVRYNGQTGLVSLTTGKEYTPVGGELTVGTDKSTTCVRSPQNISINGKEVKLKAYNIGGNNFFKLRDLGKLLNFQVDYIAASNTAVIASPLTPERQEATYAYDMFFRPEIDGESQPFVGDTMPYYEDGTYYIYYLKEGGDSYNHSVYLTTTKDFVNYTERPTPVLDASRADVQDSWIGTGSVVKADKDYYFFYTGFNASGSQEYHEKIMAAKGTSPTDFTKVSGLSITPPAELNQKNDFRDPQAYYDPATRTISLTVTASKNGAASILKYTLDKDLTNVTYDGVIFTDPTGAFWNLECSDTFQIGDKWYLTYSGQEDAVWYATADSRFGPYSEPHGSPVRHHRQADLPVRGKQQRHLYGAQAVYAVTGAYRQPRQ